MTNAQIATLKQAVYMAENDLEAAVTDVQLDAAWDKLDMAVQAYSAVVPADFV